MYGSERQNADGCQTQTQTQTPQSPPCPQFPPCPRASPLLLPLRVCGFLFFFFEVPDPLVDIGIYGVIGLGKIAGREEGPPNMLHVVVADGVCKNWQQVVDSELGRLHLDRVVKLRVHASCMDVPPSVAETIRVIPAHLEALGGAVLQNRDSIVGRRKNDRRQLAVRLVGCARPSW